MQADRISTMLMCSFSDQFSWSAGISS